MTGPSAAEQEPTNIPAPVDELIMRVSNLEPAQVGPEVGTIAGSRSGLLANVARRPDPSSVGVDVIEAIHGALLTTDDSRVRTNLASWAIFDVRDAIEVRVGLRGSAELAERAALLTEVIGYPVDRAEALLGLANSMINASADKTGALLPQAMGYIEHAADGLVDYMGRGHGVYTDSIELSSLYKAAEFSASNAGEQIKAGSTAQIDAPIRIHKQTAQIIESGSRTKYGAGLEKSNLVNSIIESAGKVARTADSDTDLEQALVDMSEAKVAEILESYEGELRTQYAYITLDMKCEELTNLGSGMIDAMVDGYGKGQNTAQMQRLIKQAVTVFEAAGNYAERFDKSRKSNRKFSGGRSIFASSEKIAKAAQSVVGIDFESSKRIYEIAFGTGQIEDKVADKSRQMFANAVIHNIHEDAASHDMTQQQAIELFGLAHELLESSDMPEDNKLQQMSENAQRLIRYISSSRLSGKRVRIDEVSKSLADFVATPENIDRFRAQTYLFHTTSDSLYYIMSHVQSPKLKNQIEAKMIEVRAEENEKIKERNKPKNETERLAREVIESL